MLVYVLFLLKVSQGWYAEQSNAQSLPSFLSLFFFLPVVG